MKKFVLKALKAVLFIYSGFAALVVGFVVFFVVLFISEMFGEPGRSADYLNTYVSAADKTKRYAVCDGFDKTKLFSLSENDFRLVESSGKSSLEKNEEDAEILLNGKVGRVGMNIDEDEKKHENLISEMKKCIIENTELDQRDGEPLFYDYHIMKKHGDIYGFINCYSGGWGHSGTCFKATAARETLFLKADGENLRVAAKFFKTPILACNSEYGIIKDGKNICSVNFKTKEKKRLFEDKSKKNLYNYSKELEFYFTDSEFFAVTFSYFSSKKAVYVCKMDGSKDFAYIPKNMEIKNNIRSAFLNICSFYKEYISENILFFSHMVILP